MNISARIQELRKKANLSQEELAQELGVSRQSVSKWELNQSKPELENIVRLSELCNVSTDYILLGKETKQEIITSDNITSSKPVQGTELKNYKRNSNTLKFIYGIILLAAGILGITAFLILSKVDPTVYKSFIGTPYYGLQGYLKTNGLEGVFIAVCIMGVAGVGVCGYCAFNDNND